MQHRDWRLRVQDILEAAERISGYMQGIDFDTFAANRLLSDAIIFNLVIIGEAASRIPEEIQQRYPDIPWDDLRGNRNFIVHEYFRVALRIVWDSVTQDTPILAPLLQAMLEAETDP